LNQLFQENVRIITILLRSDITLTKHVSELALHHDRKKQLA